MALCSQLSKFQKFLTFLHFSQERLVWSWSNFDFVHAVAFCSHLQRLKIFSFFCTFLSNYRLMVRFQNFLTFLLFLRNYWSDLHQTLIFVYAVALCSQLSKFHKFLTFLHFSQELLVWSWSNFDFCFLWGTLQPIAKFHKFLTFMHFSQELLVFIKLWFLFMLWHSAASCQSFKDFSHFCIFLRNDWSDLDQT